jgi:hypothetical protein
MIESISFYSFDKTRTGSVVASCDGYTVVNSRNPYGSHSLVMVEDGEAIRHGDYAVLEFAYRLNEFGIYTKNELTKIEAFLERHGDDVEIIVEKEWAD